MKTLLPNTDWTDEQWGEFRNTLKSILAEQVAEVTFTKVNTENKDKPARKTNENSLAVFDTQAKGWRSFVIKNIQTVKYN
jgi:hypothetical protein